MYFNLVTSFKHFLHQTGSIQRTFPTLKNYRLAVKLVLHLDCPTISPARIRDILYFGMEHICGYFCRGDSSILPSQGQNRVQGVCHDSHFLLFLRLSHICMVALSRLTYRSGLTLLWRSWWPMQWIPVYLLRMFKTPSLLLKLVFWCSIILALFRSQRWSW